MPPCCITSVNSWASNFLPSDMAGAYCPESNTTSAQPCTPTHLPPVLIPPLSHPYAPVLAEVVTEGGSSKPAAFQRQSDCPDERNTSCTMGGTEAAAELTAARCNNRLRIGLINPFDFDLQFMSTCDLEFIEPPVALRMFTVTNLVVPPDVIRSPFQPVTWLDAVGATLAVSHCPGDHIVQFVKSEDLGSQCP